MSSARLSPRTSRRLTGLGLVPVGLAIGLATAVLHPVWWGFAPGVLTTGVALWAAPSGWPRVGYAVGWLIPLAVFATPRPEGDFLISGDLAGYGYLALGLVVLAATLGTLPRPGGAANGRPMSGE